MTDENRIGRKITTLRESLQLSPEQLAERCDCDVSTINGLEAGDLYPIADADRDLTVLDDIDRQAGVSGLEDGGAGEELDGAHQAALGLGGWAMHKRSALRIDEPAPLGTGRGKAEHAGQEGVP